MPKERPEPVERTVVWNTRGALLAVGAAALAIAVLAYGGRSRLDVVFLLLPEGILLIVWLAAAAGLGALALHPFARHEADAPRVLLRATEAALGLGLMSLAMLGLGLAGVISGIAVIGVGLAAGAFMVWRHRERLGGGDVGAPLRQWLSRPAGWHWLWLAALPLGAVALVGACVPPGMLWTPDEPHGYDVVAYHFQVPREWYEAGRIVPLTHNVFSYFPFGVEMHYLLAMSLRGGPWKGMYLAQLMHLAHVVLSVVAVYGLASSVTRRRGVAIGAALLMAAVPWLALLAPVGYNEGGLLLYGTLGIGWALRGAEASGRAALARFSLAGAMAGFACGVKLTAVPMLLAGVPVAVIIAYPRQALNLIAFVAVGSALYAPWALRNLAWAGNPVFPEGMRLLGHAHFTPTQVERWERAHSPREDQRHVGARLRAMRAEVVGNWKFGYVALTLGLIAIGFGVRERRTRVLAVLLVLFALFWLSLTHLQGRFFVVAVPVTALLVGSAGWGRADVGAALLAGAAGASAVASWVMVHGQVVDRLYVRQADRFIGVEDVSYSAPPEVLNLPPGATLSLIGEAKAFLFHHPMRSLRYRTVFDVDPGAGADVVSMWRGRTERAPGEWELISPDELQRFADTYWVIPQPPAELKGKVEVIVLPPGR